MTRTTRYFMLGSTLVLALGFVGLLVAHYGGFPTIASQHRVPELSYIPDDKAIVALAYADVNQVMNSDLRQRLRALEGHESKGQQEFEEKTGINIERDIDHIVACMTSRRGEGDDEPAGLVVARGRFNENRIEQLVREHGAAVEQYRGKRVITLGRAHGGQSLVFAEPSVVLLGSSDVVRQSLEANTQRRNVTAREDLMKLVSEIPSGSTAWAVGRFDSIARRAKLPDTVARRLPPIERFAVSSQINGGLSATLRAETRDQEAAQNLQEVLRGFIALAKLQQGSNRHLDVFLQSVQLGGSDKSVELSFTIPSEAIDAFLPKTVNK